MFALITVFLGSLGSLHIFAILGSILSVGGSKKGMVPAFINFQIAAGDRSCFNFSNQDGLFTISCSLAALFQTTKMRMPAPCCDWQGKTSTSIGMACSALLSLNYFQVKHKHPCCQCTFCEKRWCYFPSSLRAVGR